MSTTAIEWWVVIDQEPTGPYTQAYLQSALRSGRLSATQLACPVGTSHWRTLADWPQLRQGPTPPTRPQTEMSLDAETVGEVRIQRAILWFYLIANPALWALFIVLGSLSPDTYRAGTSAAILSWLVNAGFNLASLLALAGATFGGWRLRQRCADGVPWIMGSTITNWIITGVTVGLQLGIDWSTAPELETADSRAFHASAFGISVSLVVWGSCLLAWLAQMMSLLWLWLRPPALPHLIPAQTENNGASSV
ncbi:MAG TPA: GYF domain-containing protein [Planctomycetaceae bacterium]|nr:GYF domain-containing protein [Planctomycetaceae bacterium]